MPKRKQCAQRPLKPQPLGRKGYRMTRATESKVRTLIRITEKNMPRASRVRAGRIVKRSPFAGSAAKYYPALKKLAAE